MYAIISPSPAPSETGTVTVVVDTDDQRLVILQVRTAGLAVRTEVQFKLLPHVTSRRKRSGNASLVHLRTCVSRYPLASSE